MGCSCTLSHTNSVGSADPTTDLVHSLSIPIRKEYLLFGYCRTIGTMFNVEIPNEIQALCYQYMQGMEIKSDTEIENERLLRMPPKYVFTVCLLGAGAVGLTAIVERLMHNNFKEDYDPTIEDWYRHKIVVDGQVIMLNLLDTAGQEEFAALHHTWMRSSNAFVLCYAVNQLSTFQHVKGLLDEIKIVKEDEAFAAILVGNKCDLPDGERQVTYEMGEQFARQCTIPFLETSAKSGINIGKIFDIISREMIPIYGKQEVSAY
eukprot:599913_1